MERITWKCQCFVCKRPIHGGRPCVVFSTNKAGLVGICHSGCSYSLHRFGYYWMQMCPPFYLSEEHLSFLKHFYPKLHSLPGGQEPNRELRFALAYLDRDYPASLVNPLATLRKFIDEHKRYAHEWKYQSDLEMDFLRSLAEIQKSAKTEPAGFEVDFRS